MSRRPAVVFGLLHAGLTIVRALGRAGAPVTGITWRGNEFGLSSRYVSERVLFLERDENVELVLDRWTLGYIRPRL